MIEISENIIGFCIILLTIIKTNYSFVINLNDLQLLIAVVDLFSVTKNGYKVPPNSPYSHSPPWGDLCEKICTPFTLHKKTHFLFDLFSRIWMFSGKKKGYSGYNMESLGRNFFKIKLFKVIRQSSNKPRVTIEV